LLPLSLLEYHLSRVASNSFVCPEEGVEPHAPAN
jgi:hypothetical protein